LFLAASIPALFSFGLVIGLAIVTRRKLPPVAQSGH
jgi:hypothetical protein